MQHSPKSAPGGKILKNRRKAKKPESAQRELHQTEWAIRMTWAHAILLLLNKPQQIGFNHDYDMTFSISLVNVSIFHLKYKCRARSESRFACYSYLYITQCPLTTGIVTCHCSSARDDLPVLEFPMNGVGDWRGEYGDARSPSLHTRLFATGHM